MAQQVFEGVRVADFTWAAVGPIITRYLAAHGATVIHIESATRPDILRVSPPFKDGVPGLNRTAYFTNFNSNKYGLSLNLNHPLGVEIARRIVAWADIVVESYTPGTMERWGLGYDDLVKTKPEIIMLSTCNQGQTGPHARHPGYGTQLVSLVGFTQLTGWPDRLPAQPYGAYTDLVAPKLGVAALVAAMIYRLRTGRGQYLDLSQYEAGLQFQAPVVLDYEVNGREQNRQGNRCSYAAPHGAYPCRGDDRWCVIAVFSDQEWQSLCRVMGKPEWARDPKFATLLSRKRNELELDQMIGEWTINYSAEEVMSLLQAAGVAAGVVENGQDIDNDPQLRYRHHFWVLDHPEIGPHKHEGPSFQLSKTPAELVRAGSCLGEHNEYVCREVLGMSDKEFVELVQQGVFE